MCHCGDWHTGVRGVDPIYIYILYIIIYDIYIYIQIYSSENGDFSHQPCWFTIVYRMETLNILK